MQVYVPSMDFFWKNVLQCKLKWSLRDFAVSEFLDKDFASQKTKDATLSYVPCITS